MSDWAIGYRRALLDLEHLAEVRKLLTPALRDLCRDMQADADVIEHEVDSRLKKRRLKAAREALLL